jgi:TonB-dependent receptor
VIVGLSQEDRLVRYDRFQIMRYEETVIDDERLVTPNDVRTTVEREDRRRRSAIVGADWRVSRALRLDADLLASTFDNSIREDRLVYGLGPRLAEPGAVLRVEDGVVTAARIADGRIDSNTEFSDQAHLNVVGSLGAEVRLGGWRLTPRLSASRARSILDTPLERYSAQSPDGVGYVFDLGDAASSRRAARLTTDFDLMDPSRLALAQLSVRAVESRDDDVTALFDARRPLSVAWGGLRLSALQLGGQVSDRSRDYERRDRKATLRSPNADLAGLYGHATPDDVFAHLILDRSAPWAVADFERMRSAFFIPGETDDDVVFQPGDLSPTGSDSQNSYRVGEQVAAGYVRLDFDGQAGGYPLFGNLGFRWVATRTQVEGARMESVGDVAEIRPVAFDGEHDVLLPSLNLAFDLSETAVLRLAASRSITRPSLADLRASTVPASVLISAVYDYGQAAITDPAPGVIFSGVGGNPDLAPYVSTNLDLSYEVTQRRMSFSVAVFRKIIDDFVQAVEAPELLTFETRDGPAVQAEILMARPRNVGRATIDGLEIGLNRRLPAGFGLWASATWTDSRLDDGGRLTGVSDLAWSVSPYWEGGPLALNLSWSWRSPFRSEADMQGGGVSNFMVAAAGYLDAQLTYDVAGGTQLLVAASNLTDTRDFAYESTRSRLLQLGSVGRQISFSLRFTR